MLFRLNAALCIFPKNNKQQKKNGRFSLDVTKIQTTKLLILVIFYFNGVQVLAALITNIRKIFCCGEVLGFVNDYASLKF